MTHFTEDNTDGFTASELAEMNRALELLTVEGFHNDENHISDFINNAFPMATAEDYVTAYKRRFAA